MNITKPWYTSKTIWFNIIVAIVGMIAVIQAQYPDLAILVTVSGVLNVILRTLNTSLIASTPLSPDTTSQ